MFKYVLLSVSLSLLPITALHAKSGHSDKWYSCTKNSDCLKVDTVCSAVTAINARYKKEFAKHADELASLSICTPLSPMEIKTNKDSTAICADQRCSIKAPITK